ncbi:MAG: hypothetical protein ACKVWV_08170 [Planctomycetota bacterium]
MIYSRSFAAVLGCLALGACSPGSPVAGAMDSTAPADVAGTTAGSNDPFAAERARYEARIAELESELDGATTERIAREREWRAYTRGIAQLGALAQRDVPKFETPTLAQEDAAEIGAEPPAAAPLEADAATASAAAPALAAQRDAQIARSLRSLFTIERVLGFELLECGSYADGATGPVVLRVHDERGRPVGSLCAERLRLEASRAARTVTLVLEDGYERFGTTKSPFPGGEVGGGELGVDGPRGGEKRIELNGVEPSTWIAAMPELFGKTSTPLDDDGRWNLPRLRTDLNALLREDASAGYWRLADFGGVRGEVLLDVLLEELDIGGRRVRTLFADRLTIRAETKGVCLLLESGAQQKGDHKVPFLEGRFRVFLPSADVERWRSRGVPGL